MRRKNEGIIQPDWNQTSVDRRSRKTVIFVILGSLRRGVVQALMSTPGANATRLAAYKPRNGIRLILHASKLEYFASLPSSRQSWQSTFRT